MRGRFLQGLEEGIESGIGEHVYLVNDIYLILTYLGRDTHLFDERTDTLYTIVRSGIEFKDIESEVVISVRRGGFLIDLLCQDTGTSSLTHSTRPCEEQRLRQVIIGDGIFQGVGDGLLSYHIHKGLWTIFACGYDEIHSFSC